MQERYKTWDTLKSIVGSSDRPWLAIGDFNELLQLTEHDGIGQRRQAQMDKFRDVLDVCGLNDLGFSGRQWTFEKKEGGGRYTRCRLARAVADPGWSKIFPLASLENCSGACSDHGPISL